MHIVLFHPRYEDQISILKPLREAGHVIQHVQKRGDMIGFLYSGIREQQVAIVHSSLAQEFKLLGLGDAHQLIHRINPEIWTGELAPWGRLFSPDVFRKSYADFHITYRSSATEIEYHISHGLASTIEQENRTNPLRMILANETRGRGRSMSPENF